MKTFKSKWADVSVEDCGAYMSKEAISFCNGFRNMLKRELSPYGIDIVNAINGHYYVSLFLKQKDKYIYVSYSIPRYGLSISFENSSCHNGVLYRFAKNEKDYRGENNRFTSLDCLTKDVLRAFENRKK